MRECAPGTGDSAEFQPASLALRAAQRAFAASIESRRGAGEFRDAQHRAAARRTLSALSADDRSRLADWLSLLLATCNSRFADASIVALARVDAAIVARVRRELPRRVEALEARVGTSRIVAA
ncbi:MAG TPA: hypothetical protein VFV97_05820 [Rhodanobacteraceae bacterium]|nr:hypothetical protein [Rhodanobacteraceae bacterium]